MYSVAFLISVVFQILVSAKVAKFSPPTPHCLHNRQVYPLGNFQPSVCAHCHCDDLGHVTCAPEFCPPPRCVDFIKDPSKCCPVCPNGRNCRVPDDGTIIKFGENYFDGSIDCHCPVESLVAECIYPVCLK